MVARLFITVCKRHHFNDLHLFDKLVTKFANSQTQLEYVFANAHSHKLRYVCKRTKLRLQTHNGATHVCRNSRLPQLTFANVRGLLNAVMFANMNRRPNGH